MNPIFTFVKKNARLQSVVWNGKDQNQHHGGDRDPAPEYPHGDLQTLHRIPVKDLRRVVSGPRSKLAEGNTKELGESKSIQQYSKRAAKWDLEEKSISNYNNFED